MEIGSEAEGFDTFYREYQAALAHERGSRPSVVRQIRLDVVAAEIIADCCSVVPSLTLPDFKRLTLRQILGLRRLAIIRRNARTLDHIHAQHGKNEILMQMQESARQAIEQNLYQPPSFTNTAKSAEATTLDENAQRGIVPGATANQSAKKKPRFDWKRGDRKKTRK